MAQSSNFCPDCSNKILPGESFCSSCGKSVSQPTGKFSALSNFQQQTQQPIMTMESVQNWEGGGLFTSSKKIFTETERVAPSLLQSPNAPNPILIVIILGFLQGIFAYLIQIKTITVVGEDIPADMIDQIPKSGNVSLTVVVFPVIVVLLIWFIGSWILGLFLRGGFPSNNLIKFETSAAMRKLNAYRYVPSVLGTLIIIIILLLSPDQTVTYNMGIPKLFGVEIGNIQVPIGEYSGFGVIYDLATPIIQIIVGLTSLYLLYKAVMANGYQGSMLIIVIAIIFFVSVFPSFSNLF